MAKRNVPHPHDTLARHFLSAEDVAADLLRRYIDPATVSLLDLDKLKCESTGAVDETLSEYIGDLRFSTTFKKSKRRSDVFIFIEHQSKKERLIGFRLLRYIVNAYEKLLETGDGGDGTEVFPYPVAVVLYHGKSKWKDMPRMPDLIQKVPGADPEVLKFPLFLIDLAAIPSEAIEGEPALRALLAALQAAGAGNLDKRIDSITGVLAEAKSDRRVGDWMTAMLTYVSAQFKFRNLKEFYVRSFGKIYGRKEAEDMAMTSAEELWVEGATETIIDVLEARFGPVPGTLGKAIVNSSIRRIKSLTKLAATCKTLDDFKRALKK